MLDTVIDITIVLLLIALIGASYRVLVGPSLPDRVMALDAIAINVVGIIATISIKLKTLTLVDIILVIGILGFIGTVSFSKFLVKGVIIDRTSD